MTQIQKISLYSGIIVLITTTLTFFGWESISHFIDEHQGPLSKAGFVILVTAEIIYIVKLIKSIGGVHHHDSLHNAEEILIGFTHANYFMVAFKISNYIRGVEFDSNEARALHEKYLLGIIFITITLIASISLIITPIANVLAESLYIPAVKDGMIYNVSLAAVGLLHRLISTILVAYLVIGVLVLGRKNVASGYVGLVLIGGKAIYKKAAKSGYILTFSWLKGFVQLWQTPKEITLDCEVNTITATKRSAIYEMDNFERLPSRMAADSKSEDVRFCNDPLHMMAMNAKVSARVILKLKENAECVLFEKKISLDEVKRNITVMFTDSIKNTVQKKTAAMINGSPECIVSRTAEALEIQLKGYSDMYEITNILILNTEFTPLNQESVGVQAIVNTDRPRRKEHYTASWGRRTHYA